MASFHQKCCGNSSSSLTFSSSSIRSDFSLSLYLLSGTMLVCLLKFNWNQLFFEKMEAVYLKLYTQAQYRSVLLLGFLFKRFPRNELPNDSGFPQYKTLYLQAMAFQRFRGVVFTALIIKLYARRKSSKQVHVAPS